MHHLSNVLFFGIRLLYYYINLNSSIVCCLSCGDIYLFFDISLLASFECNSVDDNPFGGNPLDFFDVIVIWSAILLPIKSLRMPEVFFELLFLKQFLLHLLQIF